MAASTPASSTTPTSSSWSKYAVICAVDFGTARTGFAWLYTQNPGEVYDNPPWPQTPGGYPKTSTEIILTKDTHEVVAFGFAARNQMASMNDAAAAKVLHFSKFKMFLDPNSARAVQVKASNCDETLPLVEVISKVLETVKKEALKVFASQGRTLVANSILWVLTVPAIWDSAAKTIMTEAAQRAGYGTDNVMLALEPEAASLYCMFKSTLPTQFHRPGTRYIIIDAGGGTVDITVHEIQSDLSVHELLPASGGAWGSTYVDDGMLRLIEEIFGQTAIAAARKFPDWVEVLEKIESNKMSCTPESVAEGALRNLDFALVTEVLKGTTIKDCIARFNTSKPGMNLTCRGSSTVRISSKIISDIITPLAKKAADHVATLLESVDVSLILLVGGFSESPIYQKIFRDRFATDTRLVIIPQRPGFAVLFGAVLFGLNPGVISSRSSMYTYGIDMMELWNSDKHGSRPKIVADGKNYCGNVFDIFIMAGQPVDLVSQVRRVYTPVSPDQAEVELCVYRSKNKSPKFTNEEGVKYVGVLSLPLSDIGRPIADRQVEVLMKFGGTNITVSAIHKNSGELVNAQYREYLNDAELPQKPVATSPYSIDLCFAMDCTGSMSSWITRTKEEVVSIAGQIRSRFAKSSLRIAFIGYRDHCDTPIHAIHPFNEDAGSMKIFLEAVKATGGGDTPEDVLGALMACSQQKWTSSARVLVHIGDAPCHGTMYHSCGDDSYPDGDPNGLTHDFVLRKLAALKIDYYFMKLNNSTDQMANIYSNTYKAVSGRPIHMIDIGSNVAALLPTVVECVVKSITKLSQ
ncbi:heat shock 70 kDa protein 12A [Pelomyxa schiedti]|nr:heat shock 70 kDa protein 12A [Pelomyxa schiedti]